jgi:peptidyl-tRNA hydrolase, PTH1 family
MSAVRRLFGAFRKPRESNRDSDDLAVGKDLWLIAGLGNPGGDYAGSRHNAGYMTIDRLAERHGASLNRRRFKGATGEAAIGEHRTLLVKPETYYNLSGECVAANLGYFKIPIERLIVVHDEVDLPEGRLQLRRGGGDAGNKGVRSVTASLGSPDFIRVRIGTGRDGRREEGLDFLLRKLDPDEVATLAASVARAAEAAEAIVESGLTVAMNRFNQRS